MSPQWGSWNFSGEPGNPAHLEQVIERLYSLGPDRVRRVSSPGLDILHSAFCTTRESHLEEQPYVGASGALVLWDGRLDNSAELRRALPGQLPHGTPDGQIVAAALDCRGIDALPQILGDWALSVYQPAKCELILAKDFVGIRPLYYRLTSASVTWSSSLEALLLENARISLSEQYLAAWFTHFPTPDQTPYHEIQAVPPGSFVRIVNGRALIRTYWTFDGVKNIHYKRDEEYEEHFRQVFRESVRRRLRSSHPVVAELSGGMDSSSIVCMADDLISSGMADVPRLDTLSRFDPSDSDWDEQPYFSIIEQKRGRPGYRIDVSRRTRSLPEYLPEEFAATPSAVSDSSGASTQMLEFLRGGGNRVILSGIGGDELLGGVATPIPELADLLVRFRFSSFVRQAAAWSLTWKRPMLGMALEAIEAFLPLWAVGGENYRKPPEWIEPGFAKRNSAAMFAFDHNFRILGPLPSFQSNLVALDSLRRQLASVTPMNPPLEVRYPYLDRDLWTFVCAIPCQQVLRPRQRRSLMRRAMTGIVPAEILGRPNKGFVARGRMLALAMHWPILDELSQNMTTATLGMVDARIFRKVLERARSGQPVPLVAIYRTLTVEGWLRHLTKQLKLPSWSYGFPDQFRSCRASRNIGNSPFQLHASSSQPTAKERWERR